MWYTKNVLLGFHINERTYIMRKKGICFGLILALLLPFVFTTEVKASDNTELNIYALYLNSEKKGDSTLLESKGHYLLIDIGADNHAPAIIKQLQTLGVTHVDVMFSHLHTDHTGGCSTDLQAGLKQFALSGITIDTLYLPDPSLAVLSRSYPSRYAAFQAFMSTQGTGRIVYLNVGDQVNVGDATGKVIGPVNTNEISPYAYTSITKEKERFIRYENNCSLAVIFTCGNTRYFTAGDSYSDESDRLVSRYGTSLKCDIMKMNHHGIGSGNSVSLLEAVQPSYAFIPNTGVSETDAKTNKWRTGTAIKRMTSYGLCYLVGNEEKTLIFHIENDKITLYRGDTVETGKKMTGWQSLYGADGLYRDHDMYYFDKNGYSAISDYFADLAKKSTYSKTVRIQKNKIFAYIKALKEYGTRIGNPIVKHIQGDLWELRPLNNRIFFFYWKDNKFVLLHYYIKKTQKTPHREISKALAYMHDWLERNNS